MICRLTVRLSKNRPPCTQQYMEERLNESLTVASAKLSQSYKHEVSLRRYHNIVEYCLFNMDDLLLEARSLGYIDCMFKH
jgi:hypothetical protein